MQLLSRSEMTQRLSAAWAFLSGEPRAFMEGVSEQPNPGESQFLYVMPVVAPSDQVDRLMAIGLLMDARVAFTLAAFMFGSPLDELTQADMEDVCRESCNVLGSCLVKSDDGQSIGVELGLPQAVTADVFAELQANATVSVTFLAHWSDQRVVITIFDTVDAHVMESLS